MEKQNPNIPTDSEITNGHTIEKVNADKHNTGGEKDARIKIARVDSLVIYEVSEGDLQMIERGSPNSIFLNFSIFLLSAFISFLIALLTCSFDDKDRTFYIFLIVCITTGILGILLFIIWLRTGNEINAVIRKIKDRIIE